jgi:hypothetical protein
LLSSGLTLTKTRAILYQSNCFFKSSSVDIITPKDHGGTMILGLFTLLFACGDKTEDTAVEVSNSCPNGAEITISSTYPTSGAADFYVLDTIQFNLSAEDPAASLALFDASGASVSGTSSVDGAVVTFVPDAALTASSAYTAALSYCNSADPVEVAFNTSSLGEALTTDLVGKTYAVDLASGNFVQPPGIGSLIGGLFENNILLGIKSAGDELEIIGALSEAGNTNQDKCTETLEDFPAADFSASPYFEIPEGDVTLTVAGYTATIHNLAVSGMFAADASYFGGGELSGQLDAREIVDIVVEAGLEVESADDVCGLVAGFGVMCTECASDGEAYCITLEVNRLVANETGAELISVTPDDIAANPECAQ